MKGYELYSWLDGNTWTFTLVMGTNRVKSFDEIVALPGEERGLVWLKDELERLPPGETVFWSAGRVPGTTLPPEDVIRAVQSRCAQLGPELYLLGTEPPEVSRVHIVPGGSHPCPDGVGTAHWRGRSQGVGELCWPESADHLFSA